MTDLVTSAPPPPSAKVAEAARFDAEGNHEQAVNVLALACAAGDVDAMTQLGKRLLTGNRAPYLAGKGTELVIKAANAGSAEAAAQLAVLAAIGMHVPQSWQTSMGAIVFAAERGSSAARGQLRVLARDRELAARAEGAVDAAVWRQLAETIDLNRWHQPPPSAVTVNEAPFMRRLPEFTTPEVCRWLIERSRGRLTRAHVYDAVAREEKVSATRTNTLAQFNVNDADLVSVLVQVQMCATTGVAFRQLEPLSVLHYDTGEESTEHFDFIDPLTEHYEQEVAQRGERVLTFLLYLNDDYDGGETDMVAVGIKHKGRCGDGFFFVNALEDGSPDRRTLHAGRAPTRGEKWIVSQFIRNRPTF